VKITYNGDRQGVRIRVNPTRLGRSGAKLPGLIDGGYWRHPVYGHRARWAGQTGRKDWFTGPAERSKRDASRQILKAMETAARQIERKS
jgi:hypothetical protein